MSKKNDMLDFTSQTVIVTGASRGIGKATAKLFLERGAKVFGTGTSSDADQALLKEMGDVGEFEYLQADFSSSKGIDDFIKKIKAIPRIDVCINNAGINLLHEIESIPDSDYDEVISVNLNAPVKISRYLAEKMKAQKYGRIVNVASIWSAITRPKRGIYTISKNALVGLTQTMAIELAPHNVIINAISPGFTMTELTENTNTQEELDNISNSIPAKRLANPEEMANVILFLSSKENSYLTGQNIIVDGGFTNV
jgi:3-oxoacyl-[acyl-carrier protein] reductase